MLRRTHLYKHGRALASNTAVTDVIFFRNYPRKMTTIVKNCPRMYSCPDPDFQIRGTFLETVLNCLIDRETIVT